MRINSQAFLLAFVLLIILFGEKQLGKSAPPKEPDYKIKITSLADAKSVVENNSENLPIIPETPNEEPAEIINPEPHATTAINDPIPVKNLGNNFPSTNAVIAFVEDLTENKLLFESRTNQRWPIASLTKLMTAVVAVENIGLEQQIEIGSGDIEAEGTAGDFQIGDIFDTQDLIAAMLLVSSNDAASALARHYGTEKFIESMRSKAKELEMDNTTFFDPTGLSSLNQSTVYDLQKLVHYIIDRYPQLFTTTRFRTVSILNYRNNITKKLTNINKFAGMLDFYGGKTGYIDEAKGNLISVFQNNGHRIFIAVLGANDRFSETQKLYEWTKNMLK